MGKIEKAHILAQIAKLAAEVWGIVQEKSDEAFSSKRKIQDLEAEIAKLKERIQNK